MLFQTLKVYTISRCTYKEYQALLGTDVVEDRDLPIPPKNGTNVPMLKSRQGDSAFMIIE